MSRYSHSLSDPIIELHNECRDQRARKLHLPSLATVEIVDEIARLTKILAECSAELVWRSAVYRKPVITDTVAEPTDRAGKSASAYTTECSARMFLAPYGKSVTTGTSGYAREVDENGEPVVTDDVGAGVWRYFQG